jgi:POT family proton-dependent oligopeptide transporter
MALLTVGELYILPVGLALFGRMAPKGFEATTLALWFLAAFAGNLAAGVLGTLWSVLSHPQFFSCIAAIAATASAALSVLASRNRTLAMPQITPASYVPQR